MLATVLNAFNSSQSGGVYIINYVWIELLVCAIEAATYTIYFPKYSKKRTWKKWHPTLYALAANAMSYGVGLYLAHLMPRLF